MISYYGIVTLFNILYVCIAQVHAPVVDVCCTWPWCPRFATEPDGPLGFPGLRCTVGPVVLGRHGPVARTLPKAFFGIAPADRLIYDVYTCVYCIHRCIYILLYVSSIYIRNPHPTSDDCSKNHKVAGWVLMYKM